MADGSTTSTSIPAASCGAPDGFTGVSIPIAVHGTDLVFPNGSVPLVGPVSAIAAGLDPGPPDDVDALTSRIADFFERARRELSKQP
jgi:hypothetical protein